MRTLEVLRNGSVLCIAGTEEASLLSLHLNLFIEEPNQGTLGVSGMNELEGQRSSHTYWLEEEILAPGDALNVRFTDSESAESPTSEVATDSEKYIADQKWYQSEVDKGLFEPRAVVRKWPDGSLSFCVPGVESVVATFEGEREFITLSLSWNQWPGRLQVFPEQLLPSRGRCTDRKQTVDRGQAATRRELSGESWNLTPPSSGRRKGRFAPFAPPLMSNVRRLVLSLSLVSVVSGSARPTSGAPSATAAA